MSNHIQIEPATTTCSIKAESKRSSSLYACISKLMKMRTEIRKHRTLPNDLFQEKCLLQDDLLEQDDEDDFSEKIKVVHPIKPAAPPSSWSHRHTTQLALPPRLNLISNHDFILPSSHPPQEHDFESSSSTCSSSSSTKFNQQDSDCEEEDDHNYVYGNSDSYSMTLQKLSGISFEDSHPNKPRTNTAVLITLSPCALAAANAARQKRQKIRTFHH
ncbi:hypothetical protein MAM1_0100d05199 [Mucor ambiguus]|uniref:Uncharacterized protein n=1 Tax=Mucor ambiguus TaxID=91626 RepID=A0A0C9LUW3_9FUNG|nr:hypothetical protein MAM1_0100d05199 [Mucor ambiguus]